MNPSSDATGSRFEVVATVIPALAAVATAWSGYQASRWHGEQAIAFSRAKAARVELCGARRHRGLGGNPPARHLDLEEIRQRHE